MKPGSAASAAPGLRFDPSTRNLEVSFFLAQEEKVVIQAFDAQGKVMATLLEGRHAAGSHKLSIFSNGLDASAPLVFQMRIGGQLQTFKD